MKVLYWAWQSTPSMYNFQSHFYWPLYKEWGGSTNQAILFVESSSGAVPLVRVTFNYQRWIFQLTKTTTHATSSPCSFRFFRQQSTVFIGYCDHHLVTRISDIVTTIPIPKANFRTVALLSCDYLLVYLLDIVTILPSSQGSHNIR